MDTGDDDAFNGMAIASLSLSLAGGIGPFVALSGLRSSLKAAEARPTGNGRRTERRSRGLQTFSRTGPVPTLEDERKEERYIEVVKTDQVVQPSSLGRRVGARRRPVKSTSLDVFDHAPAAGALTTMTAAGKGGGMRKSVTSIMNDMLKRQNRVMPLGYTAVKRGHAANGTNSLDELPIATGEEPVIQLASGPKEQKRVLILMSDTGGGHRASAEAIKATFELEYGDEYKVYISDMWKEHTPWPFNQMPKSYSFLVKHETLWKVAFHVTKPRFVHQPQMAATSAFVAREIAKGLDMYKPSVIVSVHPLMQHIPLRVLRSRGQLNRTPFTTVITDLTTCHPTWFHKLATVCFCPTKDVAQRALKAGLKPHQIRIHGLPIRPTFGHDTAPKEELRRDLGMDTELPAVLLMGGGEGMGPVESTAKALGRTLAGTPRSGPKGQLVVICGRNKKLQAKLEAHSWPMPVLIKGFVTNMSEWMAASDCVITKAGPGTIAESMIRGLPMILNDFIAGQEVGNVPFVVNNGAGKFCENPREIAQIVGDWFGPKKGELREMSENALKIARPDAVFKIVHDLDQLARRKDHSVTNHQMAIA